MNIVFFGSSCAPLLLIGTPRHFLNVGSMTCASQAAPDSQASLPGSTSLNFVLLTGETIKRSVESIHQPGMTSALLKMQIVDFPEAADCSNFQLMMLTDKGDFVELGEHTPLSIYELKEGGTLELISNQWNRHTARTHLRTVRDILSNGLPVSLADQTNTLTATPLLYQPDTLPSSSLAATSSTLLAAASSSSTSEAQEQPNSAVNTPSSGPAAPHEGTATAAGSNPSTTTPTTVPSASDASSLASSSSTVTGSSLLHNLLRQQMQLADTTSWLPAQEVPLRPDPNVFTQAVPPVLMSREGSTSKTPPPAPPSPPPSCLKSITYSGFNPPPEHRTLMGDLLYVDVETLEGQYVCLTASSTGWFVNGTQGVEFPFQPAPASHGNNAHSIVVILKSVSPAFAKGYAALLQEAKNAAKRITESSASPWDAMFELGLLVPSANNSAGKCDKAGVPSYGPESRPGFSGSVLSIGSGLAFGPARWVVQASAGDLEHGTSKGHMFNPQRAEDDLSATFGMDERGALRDWNDELQSCREFQCKSPEEETFRARASLKVSLDFVEAAVQGVMAISAGHILPLNPGDNPGQQVFVFNSIFFSYALSVEDKRTDCMERFEAEQRMQHYHAAGLLTQDGVPPPPPPVPEGGGLFLDVDTPPDASSVSASNHDLRMLRYLQSRDLGSLRTLATAIVEHQGRRYVAQSIIPGILQGEQVSTLLYGSVNNGIMVAHDAEMHDEMLVLGEQLHLAERVVRPLGYKAHVSATITPLHPSKDEEGVEIVTVGNGGRASTAPVRLVGPVECKGINGSDGRKYILDLVRLTPVDMAYYDARSLWYHSGSAAGAALYSERLKSPTPGAQMLPNVVPDNGTGYMAMLRPELIEAFVAHEVSQGRPAPKFNVNIGTRFESRSGDNSEQREADMKTVRAASAYLKSHVVPAAAEALLRQADSIIDGEGLTKLMHSMGLNMRYLGAVAAIILEKEVAPDFGVRVPASLLPLIESEIVARAACKALKHQLLQKQLVAGGGAYAVAKFLNVLLGKPAPRDAADSGGGAKHSTGDAHSPVLPKAWRSSIASHHSRMQSKMGKTEREKQDRLVPAHVAGVLVADTRRFNHIWYAIMERSTVHFGYKLRLWETGGYRWSSTPEMRSSAEIEGVSTPPPTQVGGVPVPTGAVPVFRRLHRHGLLRRIAQKMGIQFNCLPTDWNTSRPIQVQSIEAIVPVVKHCVPTITLASAHELLDAGRKLLRRRMCSEAFEAVNSAMGLLYQVAGAAHPDIADCCSLLSLVLWQSGDRLGAVTQQHRALLLLRRLRGPDHCSVIKAHDTLAALLAGAGLVRSAVAQYRMAASLLECVAGSLHPACVSTYVRMGMLYHDVRHPLMAIKCFKVAQQRCTEPAQAAACHHAVAMAHCSVSDFRGALAAEKLVRACHVAQGGAGGAAAAKATAWMKRFTQKALAVQQEMAAMPDGVRLSTEAFLCEMRKGAAEPVAAVLEAAPLGSKGIDAATVTEVAVSGGGGLRPSAGGQAGGDQAPSGGGGGKRRRRRGGK